jgi:RNA polymerase sigma-70 factor (ECF subfamily)
MSETITMTLNSFLAYAAGVDIFISYQSKILASKGSQFPTDEVIAYQISSGRIDQVDLLVNRYSDRLFRIILRLTQSYGAAEDILQDTWIKVMRKIHQYDPSRPFFSWLTRIAVNGCRDYWRKERRRIWKHHSAIHEDGDSNLEETYIQEDFEMQENRVMVSRALMKISQKLREVVVLKFFNGMTYEEIAQVLDIPAGTVKSRLHYALFKLRDHLIFEGAE